jgi:hypothetical protein
LFEDSDLGESFEVATSGIGSTLGPLCDRRDFVGS